MQTVYRCPSKPHYSKINGCGAIVTGAFDSEDWYDCPSCGLAFSKGAAEQVPAPPPGLAWARFYRMRDIDGDRAFGGLFDFMTFLPLRLMEPVPDLMQDKDTSWVVRFENGYERIAYDREVLTEAPIEGETIVVVDRATGQPNGRLVDIAHVLGQRHPVEAGFDPNDIKEIDMWEVYDHELKPYYVRMRLRVGATGAAEVCWMQVIPGIAVDPDTQTRRALVPHRQRVAAYQQEVA